MGCSGREHPYSQEGEGVMWQMMWQGWKWQFSWYAIINCTALVAKLYWYDTDWEWKIEMLYFWYDFPFSHFDTSVIHCRHFWEISTEFTVLIAKIPGDTKRHFYTQKRKSYLPMMSSWVTGCKHTFLDTICGKYRCAVPTTPNITSMECREMDYAIFRRYSEHWHHHWSNFNRFSSLHRRKSWRSCTWRPTICLQGSLLFR